MNLLAPRWRQPARLEEAAARYAQTRTVAIEGLLEEDFARRLVVDGFASLDRRRAWFQATCGDDKYVDDRLNPFDDEGRAAHFTFRFEQYPVRNLTMNQMIGAARFTSRADIRHDMVSEQREYLATLLNDPSVELGDNPLRTLGAFIGSPEFAEFVARITGLPVVADWCTAFASRFSHGSHLALHTDGDAERVCAFAFGFTPFWVPHWGGNLILFDGCASRPILTAVPATNRLVLFEPPRTHVVTTVTAPAPYYRYGCSGWFHSRPPSGSDRRGVHRSA